MRPFLIAFLIILLLVLLVWVGLRVMPAPLAQVDVADSRAVERMPVPEGLPAPVERFYRAYYGETIPVIHSAVIDGRVRMRPFGLWLPGRFRFVHDAGKSYRHYIEATFFGVPFLKVNEGYVNGASRMHIPIVGSSENEPKVNEGAALALWAEAAFFPAAWLTAPGVRWQPVDAHTALLVVPYEETELTLVVRFNEDDGLVRYLEAMRYHDANSPARTLWITEQITYGALDANGAAAPGSEGAVTWMDDGKPWAYFMPDRYIFNADVTGRLDVEGP